MAADDLQEPEQDWQDHDLVPISAIQHFSYCPRQAALIHLEMVWDENLYTMRGRFVHESVDEPGYEHQEGIRVERALPLWSRRWGLVGKADLVEFHGETPYPVDFKHGPRRRKEHDDLQLCAQAVCLEDMTGQDVPRGAIYHATSRHRREVEIDADVRHRLAQILTEMRRWWLDQTLPPPPNDKRCRHCSLQASCLPGAMAEPRRLERLAARTFLPEDP
jgi:CRISPR-associated exonuclease Cas4|uniref:CRISPR-associated exonuclease Cas4 n=1 Tax=Desulfobacca acetoxidans TaxID=60893 RepID=A0A7V6DP56_9BACT